jgi:ribonuclease D
MSTLQELIVSRPGELSECLEHLANAPEIGFDTEFVGEDRYRPDLCLIQLSTRERLYLVDPLSVGPLDAFWKELLDPRHTVIVHAGREEMRLCSFHGQATPRRFFDLQIVAALVGLSYPIGYGTLLHQVLNVRLPKGETLTDWRRRPLNPEQIHYAYDDVRYLLPSWDLLKTSVEQLGRTEWATEECELFVVKALMESIPAERWRKLPGIIHLDRKKLAIAREVYRWREERATVLNRPARFILRDDLIVEIAKRCPSREKEFSTLRGLGKADLAGILDAVERARSLPPAQWPEPTERDNDPPQVQTIATLLGAILSDWCSQQNLSASFTATMSDLRLLVRSHYFREPLPIESPLNRGWRRESVLPELQAFLLGKKSIRIGDLQSPTPFLFETHRSDAGDAS